MSASKPSSGVSRHSYPEEERGDLDPFYPIVDSAAWVARLVGVGARFIQLRVKEKDATSVSREMREALAICRKASAALVVNDYWRVAIDEGAPWVHLARATWMKPI